MKSKRNIFILHIFIFVCIVLMLFSVAANITQSKYLVEVSTVHNANVATTDYGFQYSVEGDICYITGFVAEITNDILIEYNPTDSVLGSLVKDETNSWVLTFPSYYTESGRIYTNLAIKTNSTSYGFPIFNLYGNASFLDRNYNNTIIEKIVLPFGVTELGYRAFYRYTLLLSISIPDSVTSIGGAAFDNCTALKSLNLPANLTTIESKSFNLCSSLTNVTIPSGVTTIESNAFGNCTRLRTIYIPSSVTTISATSTNNAPFINCSSLRIYAGASSKQSGWGRYWNYYSKKKTVTVRYNYTLEDYLWVNGLD